MPPKMGSPRRAARTRCPSSDTPHATDRNVHAPFCRAGRHVRVNATRLAGFCAASGACPGSSSGAPGGASPVGRVQNALAPRASTDTRIDPAVNLFVRAGDGRPRLAHGAVSRPVVQVSEAVLYCVPQLWKGFVMSRGLIVVDVQNDFCEGGSVPVAGGARIASAIAELVERSAGRDYQYVVATRDHHIDPGSHFSENPDFQDSFPVHCVAGGRGEFHPHFAPAVAGGKVRRRLLQGRPQRLQERLRRRRRGREPPWRSGCASVE